MTTDLIALTQLASEANQCHEQAIHSASQALAHARQVGEILVKAKGLLPHGKFAEWVAANCNFTDRTARRYMSVLNRWSEIEILRQNQPQLSMVEALDLVAEARPKRTSMSEVNEKPLDIRTEFEKHTAIVKEHRAKMRAAVESLKHVRDERLFEATHDTFEEWAIDRMGLSPDDIADAFHTGEILPPRDILPSSIDGLGQFILIGIVDDVSYCVVETSPAHEGFFRIAAVVGTEFVFSKKPIRRDGLASFAAFVGLMVRKINWHEPIEFCEANNPLSDAIRDSIAEMPDGQWVRWKYPTAA